jgi:hypothetical protein
VALTPCIPPSNSAAFSGSRCRVLSSPTPASRELSAEPSPLSPPSCNEPRVGRLRRFANTRHKMHLLDFAGRDFLSPASLRHLHQSRYTQVQK